MPRQPRKPRAYSVWMATTLMPWAVLALLLILTNCYDKT